MREINLKQSSINYNGRTIDQSRIIIFCTCNNKFINKIKLKIQPLYSTTLQNWMRNIILCICKIKYYNLSQILKKNVVIFIVNNFVFPISKNI